MNTGYEKQIIASRTARVVTAVMTALLLSSCASTQLSNTWRDPSYTSGPLKKILVVAARKDQARRRAWEDGFVAALSKHGTDAMPSYRLFPEPRADTAIINATIREQRFDGILLVGRAYVKTTEGRAAVLDLNSPDVSTHPWGGWYYAYYDHEYYPGYPVVDRIVKDEIKVWTTKGGGRMIWSGVGEVRDKDEKEDVMGNIIQIIVPELADQGVIAPGS
jgi:hypothetical protein